MHNWQKSFKRGEEGEIFLDGFFALQGYKVAPAKIEHQHMGIDRFMWEAVRPEINTQRLQPLASWFSVEYKTDARAGSTGNIFLELYQELHTGERVPGWACKFMAQILVVYIPDVGIILKANSMAVKVHLHKWVDTCALSSAVINDDGRIAYGLLVPFDEWLTFSEVYNVDGQATKDVETLRKLSGIRSTPSPTNVKAHRQQLE